jgi:predicted transcriptional regulator
MKPIDDEIMEVLRDEINLTPKAFEDLGVTAANYAGDRCRELVKYGLVENWSSGLYRLTKQGEAYLDEELDASELEKTDSTDN